MPEIVYVAGEASGDRHAAALHRAMIASKPAGIGEISAWGIGGGLMRGSGIELVADSRNWGSIGFIAALAGARHYLRAAAEIKTRLALRQPAALVLIDFGYFNVRLARWAKLNGIGPVIYYMPPGSWKRRSNPVANRELGELCDLIVTPFTWSDENLRAAGANSHWLGHPLVDIVAPAMDEKEFDNEYGIDASRPIIALLPGSRPAEIHNILPMILGASSIIGRRVPGVQFLLAAAANVNLEKLVRMVRAEQQHSAQSGSHLHFIERTGDRLKQIASHALDAAAQPQMVTSEGFLLKPLSGKHDDEQATPWHQAPIQHTPFPPSLAIVENMTYDCLARADLVITASGTATLEAAILGKPMIVCYWGSKLMAAEYYLRKRRLGISFIALPNIIAGEMVVPEYLENASAPNIAEAAVELLVEPERLMKMKQAVAERVVPALGARGVIGRAAGLIWQTIELGGQPKN